MEKSKYYTPDIEEFCVGFEVEINHKIRNGSGERSWSKEKFRMSEENIRFTKYLLENEPENIKVKYLDEQDILDLGWVKTEDKCPYTGRNYFKIVREDGFNTGVVYKIVLYQNGSLHYMWESYSSDATDKGQMIINIKNKTEFKKLMQQLRISYGI